MILSIVSAKKKEKKRKKNNYFTKIVSVTFMEKHRFFEKGKILVRHLENVGTQLPLPYML